MIEKKSNNEELQFQIDLEIASFVLRSGGTIVYPTETLWGIGCDATNEEAVEQVFELKKINDNKALIILVNGIDMLKEYVHTIPQKYDFIMNEAREPTTIIYPGAKNIAPNIIAPDGSIGIRITTHPFCLELIKRVKKPIVSTSANYTGSNPPGNFSEINIDLIYNSDYVVRWGQDQKMLSKPSRIIKILSNGEAVNIR